MDLATDSPTVDTPIIGIDVSEMMKIAEGFEQDLGVIRRYEIRFGPSRSLFIVYISRGCRKGDKITLLANIGATASFELIGNTKTRKQFARVPKEVARQFGLDH